MHPGDLSAQHSVLVLNTSNSVSLLRSHRISMALRPSIRRTSQYKIANNSIRRSSMTGQHGRSVGQDAASSFRAPQVGGGDQASPAPTTITSASCAMPTILSRHGLSVGNRDPDRSPAASCHTSNVRNTVFISPDK